MDESGIDENRLHEALPEIWLDPADVEIVEWGQPDAGMLEQIRRLCEQYPHLLIVVLKAREENKRRPPGYDLHDLTPYELRVLKLLAEGHSYRSAGAELGVSRHTVSFHLRRIYGKLHVNSKSQAVSRGLRHGLFQ